MTTRRVVSFVVSLLACVAFLSVAACDLGTVKNDLDGVDTLAKPDGLPNKNCGNGRCTGKETCSTCPEDCGVCETTCGDGVCSQGEGCVGGDDGEEEESSDTEDACVIETCETCAEDCGPCETPSCGDGVCDTNESCTTCEADCGPCPAVCGNGTCDAGEDCASCQDDCGMCPASCGDNVCDPDETCATCPADCGECAPVCGDGVCDPTESCETCEADCGPCGAVCRDAVPNPPSGHHRNGTACLGCHTGSGAPLWTVAGTLYSDASGSSAVAGATITIVDAQGQVLDLTTGQNGNFYTSTPVVFPVQTFGSQCPNIAEMISSVTTGNCNSCHGSGFRISLP